MDVRGHRFAAPVEGQKEFVTPVVHCLLGLLDLVGGACPFSQLLEVCYGVDDPRKRPCQQLSESVRYLAEGDDLHVEIAPTNIDYQGIERGLRLRELNGDGAELRLDLVEQRSVRVRIEQIVQPHGTENHAERLTCQRASCLVQQPSRKGGFHHKGGGLGGVRRCQGPGLGCRRHVTRRRGERSSAGHRRLLRRAGAVGGAGGGGRTWAGKDGEYRHGGGKRREADPQCDSSSACADRHGRLLLLSGDWHASSLLRGGPNVVTPGAESPG